MTARIITLLSDFGPDSPYVAQMKGVILGQYPAARLVDITHSIAPQNIAEAAMLWRDVTPWFPKGSIHVAVVDPGVGTERPIVAAAIGGHSYIAPDNGLFDELVDDFAVAEAVAIEPERVANGPISATFHGRDVMAPAAARLAGGPPLAALGSPAALARRRPAPFLHCSPDRVEGTIVWVDPFGNLVTNIRPVHLERLASSMADLEVLVQGTSIGPIRRTYGESPRGALLALWGSSGRLEIAVSGGSAAGQLEAEAGARVVVRAAPTQVRPAQAS